MTRQHTIPGKDVDFTVTTQVLMDALRKRDKDETLSANEQLSLSLLKSSVDVFCAFILPLMYAMKTKPQLFDQFLNKVYNSKNVMRTGLIHKRKWDIIKTNYFKSEAIFFHVFQYFLKGFDATINTPLNERHQSFLMMKRDIEKKLEDFNEASENTSSLANASPESTDHYLLAAHSLELRLEIITQELLEYENQLIDIRSMNKIIDGLSIHLSDAMDDARSLLIKTPALITYLHRHRTFLKCMQTLWLAYAAPLAIESDRDNPFPDYLVPFYTEELEALKLFDENLDLAAEHGLVRTKHSIGILQGLIRKQVSLTCPQRRHLEPKDHNALSEQPPVRFFSHIPEREASASSITAPIAQNKASSTRT